MALASGNARVAGLSGTRLSFLASAGLLHENIGVLSLEPDPKKVGDFGMLPPEPEPARWRKVWFRASYSMARRSAAHQGNAKEHAGYHYP